MEPPTTPGLAEWRAGLLRDLGGIENVSDAKLALLDLVVRQAAILQLIDDYLLESRAIVNRKRRTLHPIVVDRQRVADSLCRYLKDLGLERVPREPESLGAYLASNPEKINSPSGGTAPPLRNSEPTSLNLDEPQHDTAGSQECP